MRPTEMSDTMTPAHELPPGTPAASPPRQPHAAEPLPYPRLSDRITRRAHKLLLVTLGGTLGAAIMWADATELNKVTRGSGRVIPQLQNQTVQHLEGGIVTEILVREGDRVES